MRSIVAPRRGRVAFGRPGANAGVDARTTVGLETGGTGYDPRFALRSASPSGRDISMRRFSRSSLRR